MANKQEDLASDGGVVGFLERVPVVGQITAAVHRSNGESEKAKRAFARANNSTTAAVCVAAMVFSAPASATAGTVAACAAYGGACGAVIGNEVQWIQEEKLPSKAKGGREAHEKKGVDWCADAVGGAVGGALGGAIGGGNTGAMRPVGNALVGESVECVGVGIVKMGAKRGVERVAAEAVKGAGKQAAKAATSTAVSATVGCAQKTATQRTRAE